MDIVLGVEGDGAHTHAVLTDASGMVLGLGVNDDSSDWDSVGIAAAAAALRSCITEALNSAQVEGDAIEAAVFALAGVDFPVDERRLGGIPEAIGLKGRSRIVNDSFAALRAGTDQAFGVVIIAGNGSVVAGRNPEGVEFRSLGLGKIYGDYGSETDISEAALTAVAAAFTGIGPQTTLTTRMCESAGVASVVDLIDGTARGRIDQTLFCPVVIAAAADGDEVSQQMLTHAGAMLGATAVHVVRTLRMERTAFDLVLARHLFDGDALVEGVRSSVAPVVPDAAIRRLAVPPVVGSALLALELAGATPASDARSRLADGLLPALTTS